MHFAGGWIDCFYRLIFLWERCWLILICLHLCCCTRTPLLLVDCYLLHLCCAPSQHMIALLAVIFSSSLLFYLWQHCTFAVPCWRSPAWPHRFCCSVGMCSISTDFLSSSLPCQCINTSYLYHCCYIFDKILAPLLFPADALQHGCAAFVVL